MKTKKLKIECDSIDAASDGVASNSDNGITSNDVAGNCDHQKDGYFGPGCMHIPGPIFKGPIRRMKSILKTTKSKKKKKHAWIDLLKENDKQQYNSKLGQDIGNLKADKIEMSIAKQNNMIFGDFKLDSICFVPSLGLFFFRLLMKKDKYNYVIASSFDQNSKEFKFIQNDEKTTTTLCTVDELLEIYPEIKNSETQGFVFWGSELYTED